MPLWTTSGDSPSFQPCRGFLLRQATLLIGCFEALTDLFEHVEVIMNILKSAVIRQLFEEGVSFDFGRRHWNSRSATLLGVTESIYPSILAERLSLKSFIEDHQGQCPLSTHQQAQIAAAHQMGLAYRSGLPTVGRSGISPV